MIKEEDIIKMFNQGTQLQRLTELHGTELVKDKSQKGIVAIRKNALADILVDNEFYYLVQGTQEAIDLCHEINIIDLPEPASSRRHYD